MNWYQYPSAPDRLKSPLKQPFWQNSTSFSKNSFDAFLTFWYLCCWRIYFWSTVWAVTSSFDLNVLLSRFFLWGVQTDKSSQEPNQGNTVSVEATPNVRRVFLPSFPSIYQTVLWQGSSLWNAAFDSSLVNLYILTPKKHTFGAVYLVEKASNSSPNHRHVVVGSLLTNAAPISKTPFSGNTYCKMNSTRSFDIFTTSAMFSNFTLRFIKTILWAFVVVTKFFWATRSFHIIGVCTAMFKIRKPVLYYLSCYNRVRITLIKFFLIKKYTKLLWIHCFQSHKSGVIKNTMSCELVIGW